MLSKKQNRVTDFKFIKHVRFIKKVLFSKAALCNKNKKQFVSLF